MDGLAAKFVLQSIHNFLQISFFFRGQLHKLS